ncbi:MAG: M48 family metalloprotease [Verrucomicrobiae bacterium]|nr:M48 family metalloprotease [Verrucomicrobiae bacterium]
MTREEFDAYVDDIESRAARDPKPIRRKTRWLVFVGYLVIAALMLASILLVVGVVSLLFFRVNAVTIKLVLIVGIPSVLFCFSLLRSLHVKMGHPEGIAIKRDEAPRVFELLDDLSLAASRRDADPSQQGKSGKARPVKFDEVLITPDFNAAVAQVPRLGIFGWYKRYLILGLPLLQSVDLDEFKAVLAHEFAHLTGQHGRFGSWIYRTRATWERVVHSLSQDDSWGARTVNKFLAWFWPRFNGHAFALSRGQEYEADAFAANYAGAEKIASALARIEVVARENEEAWQTLSKRLQHEASAPEDVYGEIERIQRESTDHNRVRKWLAESYLRPTDTSDTHPSLNDRVAAVGMPIPEDRRAEARAGQFENLPVLTAVPSEQSALAALLDSDQSERFLKELSREWQQGVSEHWATSHQQLKDAAEELEKLGQLDPDATETEKIEYFTKRLAFHLDRDETEAALETADTILAIQPDEATANFVKGRLLLDESDPAGVAFIEKVITREPIRTDDCLELLYGYYSRIGDTAKLAEVKRRADKHDDLLVEAQKERNSFGAKDAITGHGLTDTDRENAVRIFATHEEVERVYAVRKQVETLADALPMVVIAIQTKVGKLKFKSSDWQQKLVNKILEELEVEKPAILYAFTAEADKRAFKKCREYPGALIYEKEAT